MAIFTLPIARVGDSNFKVGAGYKLYFYAAGTTTAKDTYTSNTYATPLSNPVVADATGSFSVIWTSGDYKVRLYTAADVLVWEVDNYSNDSGVTTFAEGVLSSPSSAANAITASLSTAPAYPYVDQLQVVVELQHGANTINNPTFNLNGLGAKTIKRGNNTILQTGDTGGSGAKIYLSYSATNDVWILLNPYIPTVTYGLGLEWKTGLIVSNNGSDATNDIDIAVGSIMDTNNAYRMNLTSAFTKRIDATFAVGTGLGGLSDDDSLTNDTWYGIWLLSKTTNTSDCDVIFATTKAKSLSDAVATAAGFTISRLIGCVRRGTATNVAFVNGGNGWYLWSEMFVLEDTTVAVSLTALTAYAPPFMIAKIRASIFATTSSGSLLVLQSTQPDTAPSSTIYTCRAIGAAAGADTDSAVVDLKTNSSGQVYYRGSNSSTDARFGFLGWKMDWTVTDLV